MDAAERKFVIHLNGNEMSRSYDHLLLRICLLFFQFTNRVILFVSAYIFNNGTYVLAILLDRHRPKAPTSYPNCHHTKKRLLCSKLTMQHIKKFHEALYRSASKVGPDNIILKRTSQCTPNANVQ